MKKIFFLPLHVTLSFHSSHRQLLCNSSLSCTASHSLSLSLCISPKPNQNKRERENLVSFLSRSLSSLTITMHNRRNPFLEMLSSLISLTLLLLSLPTSTSADTHPPPSDAFALLAFKSTADPHNKLHFSLNNSFDHCKWEGVKCSQQRKVIRFVLQGLNLGGVFGSNTLGRLDQLRLLSLRNNSLTGLIPDLSGLVNLKTLFLNHNSFSGSFPPSILSLHRLRTLDLSYNNFTGSIPTGLTGLDPLYYLRLEWNRFNGTIPPLNQSSLEIFNVSGNNLTGAIPITIVFMRIDVSSFSWNPFLCGEIIQKQCLSAARPFFGSFSPISPPVGEEANGQSEQLHGLVLPPPSSSSLKTQKKTHLIIGFSIAILLLIGSMISVLLGIRKKRKQKRVLIPLKIDSDSFSFSTSGGGGGGGANAVVMRVEEEEKELEAKVKKMQGMQLAKSGSLVFCAGEVQVYSLDQLMRASAEMLGRGSIGSTYKALLDNQMIVSVKRLDAVKTAITNKEMFERQMESVGSLRHPNLVPLRAYFQAKEERLIVYDYQPNGSLFSLIHGSRSARARPLHWTSCLKIAEDVAQGLAYIHQTSRLIHGNLKSSNVLLGADFEACVTDYCLSVLSDSIDEDPDSAAYKAPETRKSNRRATTKSDVYAFGILLLELITGKPPSQHPFIVPTELSSWVRSVREVEVGEENRLGMLLEVAITCSLTSPEQRPTMWQVMKMIQEIKEAVMIEDSQLYESTGFS